MARSSGRFRRQSAAGEFGVGLRGIVSASLRRLYRPPAGIWPADGA